MPLALQEAATGMNILGLDPGQSGGIALLSDIGILGDEAPPLAWKMPDTERDVWDLLNGLHIDCAYIERVASRPKQGVSAVFKFGMNYGMLRGYLIALGIPFESVTPGVWQRSLGCLSGGNKNVTKAKAQELFPSLKITHAIADSLLIAEYGRRVKGVASA